MSDQIITNIIVLPLPNLNDKGWNEAVNYFRDIIGEPDCIDVDDNGEVFWARYEGDYNIIKEGNKWGVERVIIEESCDYEFENLIMDIEKINILSQDLADKFNRSKYDCKMAFLSWYNGFERPEVLS